METQSHYQIDRYETLAHLDELEKEWTDLISGIPEASIFLTWEWIRTWWLYFGQGRELWLLAARDRQGRLLGIAPLMSELHRTGWMKLRTIAFIGTGSTRPPHLNILINSSDREGLLQAFLDYLLSQSKRWDVISFAALAQESALYNLLPVAGGRVRTGTKKISAYIPLPGSWDIYLKTLTKKLRRNLKYFRSKLDNDYPGGVAFTCVTDQSELPGAMKTLEELNKNRWHSKERTSNFDDPNFTNFHQTIADLAFNRGWLRLYQLKVSDRVIATCYNFLFHNRVYAYAIAFDLDWSGYSPGRLAIANSIQASIQEGASEYDWLGGEEDYKLAWTDQVRVENEILFSNNWRGGLWLEWRNFLAVSKEFLTEKARQWLPQSTRDRINQFLSPRYKKPEVRDDKDAG